MMTISFPPSTIQWMVPLEDLAWHMPWPPCTMCPATNSSQCERCACTARVCVWIQISEGKHSPVLSREAVTLVWLRQLLALMTRIDSLRGFQKAVLIILWWPRESTFKVQFIFRFISSNWTPSHILSLLSVSEAIILALVSSFLLRTIWSHSFFLPISSLSPQLLLSTLWVMF